MIPDNSAVKGRLDADPLRSGFRRDQFPIMAKDHLRRVACFQRHPRRVVQDGQPVRDERMAQAVLGPFEALALLPCRMLGADMHANRPRGLPNRSEPQFQVLRNRHEPTTRSLGLARRHGDKVPIQINLTPIEPLQFRCPQTREGTEGQVRPQGGVSLLEQTGNLFRREDRHRSFLFFVPHHAGERTGTLEQMTMRFRPITAGAQHPRMSFLVVAPSLRLPSHLSSTAVVKSLRHRPGKASASFRVNFRHRKT